MALRTLSDFLAASTACLTITTPPTMITYNALTAFFGCLYLFSIQSARAIAKSNCAEAKHYHDDVG